MKIKKPGKSAGGLNKIKVVKNDIQDNLIQKVEHKMNIQSGVKTFQPTTPAGNGPVYLSAVDAVGEILGDINEIDNREYRLSQQELDKLKNFITHSLELGNLPEGTFIMFNDYKIIVRTYEQSELDGMHEFSGY